MLTNEHEFFMNNIYETFIVIYVHLCDAVGKGNSLQRIEICAICGICAT